MAEVGLNRLLLFLTWSCVAQAGLELPFLPVLYLAQIILQQVDSFIKPPPWIFLFKVWTRNITAHMEHSMVC